MLFFGTNKRWLPLCGLCLVLVLLLTDLVPSVSAKDKTKNHKHKNQKTKKGKYSGGKSGRYVPKAIKRNYAFFQDENLDVLARKFFTVFDSYGTVMKRYADLGLPGNTSKIQNMDDFMQAFDKYPLDGPLVGKLEDAFKKLEERSKVDCDKSICDTCPKPDCASTCKSGIECLPVDCPACPIPLWCPSIPEGEKCPPKPDCPTDLCDLIKLRGNRNSTGTTTTTTTDSPALDADDDDDEGDAADAEEDMPVLNLKSLKRQGLFGTGSGTRVGSSILGRFRNLGSLFGGRKVGGGGGGGGASAGGSGEPGGEFNPVISPQGNSEGGGSGGANSGGLDFNNAIEGLSKMAEQGSQALSQMSTLASQGAQAVQTGSEALKTVRGMMGNMASGLNNFVNLFKSPGGGGGAGGGGEGGPGGGGSGPPDPMGDDTGGSGGGGGDMGPPGPPGPEPADNPAAEPEPERGAGDGDQPQGEPEAGGGSPDYQADAGPRRKKKPAGGSGPSRRVTSKRPRTKPDKKIVKPARRTTFVGNNKRVYTYETNHYYAQMILESMLLDMMRRKCGCPKCEAQFKNCNCKNPPACKPLPANRKCPPCPSANECPVPNGCVQYPPCQDCHELELNRVYKDRFRNLLDYDKEDALTEETVAKPFKKPSCKSHQVCGDFDKCGLAPLNRLTKKKEPSGYMRGGEGSKPGEWPFYARIDSYRGDNLTMCGGTLIARNLVLTAGHCVSTGDEKLPNHAIRIVLGKSRREIKEQHEESRKVTNICRASKYIDGGDAGSRYDYAVLTLDRPVKFNDYIQPACLPYDINDYDGQKCYVVGMGLVELADKNSTDNPNPSRFAMEMQMMRMKRVSCNRWGVGENDRSRFCFTKAMGPGDTCGGDSGGPVLCLDKQNKWNLMGIVSYGLEECDGLGSVGWVGAYTRVPHLLENMDQDCKIFSK